MHLCEKVMGLKFSIAVMAVAVMAVTPTAITATAITAMPIVSCAQHRQGGAYLYLLAALSFPDSKQVPID